LNTTDFYSFNGYFGCKNGIFGNGNVYLSSWALSTTFHMNLSDLSSYFFSAALCDKYALSFVQSIFSAFSPLYAINFAEALISRGEKNL
jgi:hypothetical protein